MSPESARALAADSPLEFGTEVLVSREEDGRGECQGGGRWRTAAEPLRLEKLSSARA